MLTVREERTLHGIMDLVTDVLLDSGVRNPDLERVKGYLMRAVRIAKCDGGSELWPVNANGLCSDEHSPFMSE